MMFSLQEDDIFRYSNAGSLGLAKPFSDLLSDCILCICHSLWLSFLWCGEVSAVSTCITLDVVSRHGLLRSVWVSQFPHTCILPWVFTPVQEEDIVASDVQTTIVLVGLVSLG